MISRLRLISLHFGLFTLYLLAALVVLGLVRRRGVTDIIILSVTIRNATPFSGRGSFDLTVSSGRLHHRCRHFVAAISFLGFLTRKLFRCNVTVDLGRLILLLLVGRRIHGAVGDQGATPRLRRLSLRTFIFRAARRLLRRLLRRIRIFTLLSFAGAARRVRISGYLRGARRGIVRHRGRILLGSLRLDRIDVARVRRGRRRLDDDDVGGRT